MYQVLARKWRPQSLDELVGQPHVARTMRNSLLSNRLAHAYIFAGLRGTGKTTVARILAKCLNCKNGPTPTPCNACTPCEEIVQGRSMDVLEIDAASRTGVGDIRELQEVVAYAPVRDRYKVLIVDEAHMLSKNAFNALLKTLEEPPRQVLFVLATTELPKLPATIVSRCQVFEFRRVSPREVVQHLRKICETETIEISDPVLERIALAGEGSMRDSLSVLERVLAFCGRSVRDEEAMDVLGAVRSEVFTGLMEALARRDAAAMLSLLDGLVDEGHDLVHFLGEWMGVLRDLLLLRTLPDRTDILSRAPAEAAVLLLASQGLSLEDLTRAFQIVADLEPGLKSSSKPRFLFEATLIRLAALGAVRPIEELLAAIGGDAPVPSGPSRRSSPVEGAPRSRPAAPSSSRPESEPDAVSPASAGPHPDLTTAFRAAVHRARPMLDAMVEQASSTTHGNGELVLAFPTSQDAVRLLVEREENREVLRRCAHEILGSDVRIRVVSDSAAVGGPARTKESGVKPSPSRSGSGEKPRIPTQSMPPTVSVDRQGLLERARREPGVQKLLHEFGGQVVDIRPLDVPKSLTPEGGDPSSAEESP